MLRAAIYGLIAAIATYLVVIVFVIMLNAVGLASSAEFVAGAATILALLVGLLVAINRYNGRTI